MNNQKLYWLEPNTIIDNPFPPVEHAFKEPNGLLAAGGQLTPGWLIQAYRHGIFPWFNKGEPILWWSPDPRAVLLPDDLKVSRSLHKTLNQKHFKITFNKAFTQVMKACAEPRKNTSGTWITPEMIHAYNELHQSGIAHSVEAWQNDELVGGIYGIALGQVFFGESMFHRTRDASKVAFVKLIERLQQQDFKLIDCQIRSDHLQSLGATEIPRSEFIKRLDLHCNYRKF
ncbi:MAG: leucyl/phenylalanyl-tRNA--protein transferase [Gammaproteobacteria bacterium]|nr:leucyl/phenylalanyl-tRNA--protein transferase [Gammaproteobacteria bacterium]